MTYVANISVERADDSFRAVLRFSLPVLRNSIRFLITIALVFFVSFYANSWGMLIFMVVASGVFIPIFYLAAWEAREEVVASFLNAYKEPNQPAQTTPVSAPR